MNYFLGICYSADIKAIAFFIISVFNCEFNLITHTHRGNVNFQTNKSH